MTTAAQDIREWAKESGIDLNEKGRIPYDVRDAYNKAKGIEDHSMDDIEDAIRETDEVAPKIATESPLERAKKAVEAARERGRAKASGRTSKKSGSKAKKPRVSTESVISGIWGIAAKIMQPMNLPVSRMLAFQSPVAGKLLEEQVKGTLVDTVLQPLARMDNRSQVGIALAGPPLLVAALTARPDMEPILLPMLRHSLASWLKVAGPKMEERMQEELEFEKEYGATIDGIIQMLYMIPEENE